MQSTSQQRIAITGGLAFAAILAASVAAHAGYFLPHGYCPGCPVME